MRYSETLCQHIADTIVTTLTANKVVQPRIDKKNLREKIAAALLENFRQEEALEKEAEHLADEHIRTAAQGLDRHKLVQLIKQRLAEERRFVL